MDFESKILSREISQLLWEREQTLGTAESCTGGRIAEAIIAIPGASKYFKGGIVSYVDEVKENLLGVNHDVIEEQTAVCEEVARQMVVGACRSLNTDFAIAATGYAGPTGGPKNIPDKDNPGKTKIIETSSFTKVVCNSKCPKYNTVDNG